MDALRGESNQNEENKKAPENGTQNLDFIEIKDLSHLLKQRAKLRGEYKDRNWRESYYFNATDIKRQLSLITTIGILPNKKRSSGFVIILDKNKIVMAKLLITGNIRLYETDRFSLKGLFYQVEGIDWKLHYKSNKCEFDLLFTPINEFYSYNQEKDKKELGSFKSLATQHIEQAGIFQGSITVNGKKIRFGPSFGHRDHSWGIRNWSLVNNYWLFSCTFGEDRAFNLWRGTIGNKGFHKGYILDSGENIDIISSKFKGYYKSDKKEPKGCEILFIDENNKKHNVKCKVVSSVPIPLPGCIVYETIARMEYDKYTGYGLLERHVHDRNPIHKIQCLNQIRKRRKGP